MACHSLDSGFSQSRSFLILMVARLSTEPLMLYLKVITIQMFSIFSPVLSAKIYTHTHTHTHTWFLLYFLNLLNQLRIKVFTLSLLIPSLMLFLTVYRSV